MIRAMRKRPGPSSDESAPDDVVQILCFVVRKAFANRGQSLVRFDGDAAPFGELSDKRNQLFGARTDRDAPSG